MAGLKGQPPTPVAAVNYVLAAGLSGAVVTTGPGSGLPVSVLHLGLLGGALYVAVFFLSFQRP